MFQTLSLKNYKMHWKRYIIYLFYQLKETIKIKSIKKNVYLCFCILADTIVVHPPLISQWYGPLPRWALALPHQEWPVDATAEQVLCRVARYGPMVPGVLLQGVGGGDVVAGHPAHLNASAPPGLCLAPLARAVVRQHSHLLAWKRRYFAWGGRNSQM